MRDASCDHWVFRARVIDRSGALTSIASAFSNEGVSIRTVVGHGFEEKAGIDGNVVITFICSRREKDVLVRKIRRLKKVIDLEEYPYESDRLRKSAIILSRRELAAADIETPRVPLTCELIHAGSRGCYYFLAGAPNGLDGVLERLEAEGVVEDIIYSVMGL